MTIGVATLFLAWLVAAPGATAGATSPQCGDLITTSVVLTEDLVCLGNGLEIDPSLGASSGEVTIDLNGHTIRGSGTGTGIDAHFSTSFASTLTISNGTIRGFQLGVALHEGEAPIDVTNLVIRDNDTGVLFTDFGGVLLANSTIANNRGIGVDVAALDTDFEMVNDQVRDNGGTGIRAFEDSVPRLQDSFIAHNGGDGAAFESSPAIISGNTFLGNSGTGLRLTERAPGAAAGYFVAANVANGNGNGGMSMTYTRGETSPPVPGTGNAAQHNDVFQCVVIICAKNRG
ncbi:MAG: right-handed parallel beta-helix repeat-containing protein [Gaiellaceae bacterium]